MKIKSPRVVIYSIIALGCIALAFFTKEWFFLIPAVILMVLNQRELMQKK
jgi:fumarate reductase subunit C